MLQQKWTELKHISTQIGDNMLLYMVLNGMAP